MTPFPRFEYPVIGFFPAGNDHFEIFRDEGSVRAGPRELELEDEELLGAHVIDSSGTAMEIASVRVVPLPGPLWQRAWRAMRGWTQTQDLDWKEIDPVNFNDLSERACRSIQANQDYWLQGPPRVKQELLDAFKERVRQTRTIAEIGRLLEEDFRWALDIQAARRKAAREAKEKG